MIRLQTNSSSSTLCQEISPPFSCPFISSKRQLTNCLAILINIVAIFHQPQNLNITYDDTFTLFPVNDSLGHKYICLNVVIPILLLWDFNFVVPYSKLGLIKTPVKPGNITKSH